MGVSIVDMKNRDQDRKPWEQMMKENKPTKVKEEHPRYLGWEKCVREYWDKESRGKK